jgi:predicted nucleic acid-binding protein
MTESGQAEQRFVLDTNAAIYLTTAGSVISAGLQKTLDEADLFTSVITELELFSKPNVPPEEEANLRAFIMDKTSIVDINPAIKKQTIALRRSTTIKLPDAIIAATSIALHAVLLTRDAKLLRLSWPGYRAQDILEAGCP